VAAMSLMRFLAGLLIALLVGLVIVGLRRW
jgi:hypothetical protein